MGGLVWALKSLEEMIEGKELTIYTDHSALTWQFASTDAKTKYNQRLLIWTMCLQQWKPRAHLIHKPGRAHLNADVLSRFPVDIETPIVLFRPKNEQDAPPVKSNVPCRANSVSSTIMDPSMQKKFASGYPNDAHWSSISAKLLSEPNKEYQSYKQDALGLVHYFDPENHEWKLCVPTSCIRDIFELYHDKMGHPGLARCHPLISAIFQIPNLSKKLKTYISGCHTCAVSKNKNHQQGILSPLDFGTQPCETVAMDFVVQLPLSHGYDAILTVTDKFTKMVTFIACKTNDNAKDTALRFLGGYYSRFGMPKNIISDRDVKFISKFWNKLFKLAGCKLLMSTAFSPQTDGQSERTNQTMEVMLRCMLAESGCRDWFENLPLVEFSINCMPSASTQKSPFEILYGFTPRLMPELIKSEVHDITELGNCHAAVRQEVKDHLGWARALMSIYYDRGRTPYNINEGDMVYIENRPGLKIPGLSNSKLDVKRFGPFKVTKRVGNGAAQLELPPNYKMHPVISMRHLTKQKPDEYNRQPTRPPPVVLDSETAEDVYEVENVIDKRTSKNGRRTEYLVKWLGYPMHESTWINATESDSFSELVAKYEQRLHDKLAINQGKSRLRSKRRI